MFCLSHFNQKSASPVGPYIFSRGRANFLSQIDTAKVQYRHCGSRMLAEENCAFQDLFFFSVARSSGHLSFVKIENTLSKPATII